MWRAGLVCMTECEHMACFQRCKLHFERWMLLLANVKAGFPVVRMGYAHDLGGKRI